MVRAILNFLAELLDRFRRLRLRAIRLELARRGRNGGTVEFLDGRGRRLAGPLHIDPDPDASLPKGRYAIVDVPKREDPWRLQITGTPEHPGSRVFVIGTTPAGPKGRRVALVMSSGVAAVLARWLPRTTKGLAAVVVIVEKSARASGVADEADVCPTDDDSDSRTTEDNRAPADTTWDNRGGSGRIDDRQPAPTHPDTKSGGRSDGGSDSTGDRSYSGDAFRGGGSFGGAGASGGWDPVPSSDDTSTRATKQEAAAKAALTGLGYELLRDEGAAGASGDAGVPRGARPSHGAEEPSSAAGEEVGTGAAGRDSEGVSNELARDVVDAGPAGEAVLSASAEPTADTSAAGTEAPAMRDDDWSSSGGAYSST